MSNKKDYATAAELRMLVVKQQFRCALSGRELEPSIAACDHIVAVSAGGGHGIDNLHIVHAQVNKAKGSMALDEFISMCCDVADHHRRITAHEAQCNALSVSP